MGKRSCVLSAVARTSIRLCLLTVAVPLFASAHAQPIAGSWEGELVSPDSWPVFVRLDVDQATQASKLTVLGRKIDLGRAANDRLTATIGEGRDAQSLTARVEGGALVGRLKGAGTDTSFTLTRIPSFAPTTDRVAGWNRDLDAVENRVLRYDRSFSAPEQRAVRTRIATLRRSIARLSDDAMRVRIAEVLAEAHNGHTRLYLLRNRTELGRLPIRVWWFGRELRIVRAAPQFASLVGCRVDRLNGVPVLSAYDRVHGMYAGSETWKRYMSQYTLTSPSVLHGAGVANNGREVRVSLSDCKDAGSHLLAQLPFERSEKPVESWWDLAPESPSALSGWTHALTGHQLPKYLSNLTKAYWFEAPGKRGIFYLQLNRAADAGSETVKDFAKRTAEQIGKTNPAAVAVDLRFNTGGDSNITKTLVDAVVEASRQRPLYLIVGRSTFSAGIVAAAQFRQATAVKIVGEPVGDGLEFWAEGGNIILPYSGLAAHFANGAHSLSPAGCPTRAFCNDLSVRSLAPDIPAVTSWTDYISGVDASLRAVEVDMHH